MPTVDMMYVLRPPSVKQLKNEKTLKIYAAFLCGLIIFVAAARWLHAFCKKNLRPFSYRGLRDSGCRACLRIFRKLERRTTWKWLGRPSFELLVLVGIYAVSNIVLSSTTLAAYRVNHLASRFGWMGAANMALCVFLGLKNTPLALVAAVSHTQLNILHRIVGYAAVFMVLLHAIFYTIHFGRQGRWATLIEAGNIDGLGSGVAMFIILMGIFRHRHYEIFYLSHIAGFICAVVLTGLHRPDWAKKLPVVMLFIACIWALDRIIRAARMCCNLVNNHVTFHPLPDGGTRLLLKKPFAEAALPGSHCFLWIPRIHFSQTHPFTVVSNGPFGMELVIKSHGGFTQAVCKFATQHPGCATWASVDGPYGSLPDAASYDKLILISGGSGAAFTFGLMNRILNHSEGIASQSIDFVWAVKRTEHLSWFYEHLNNLARVGSTVDVTLYVTSEKPIAGPNNSGRAILGAAETRRVMESALPERNAYNHEDISETDDRHGLLSGDACGVAEHTANLIHKKMSIENVICEAMQAVGSHQRVLIAACGPRSLLDAVRDSADSYRSKPGYRIDVHYEDFGG